MILSNNQRREKKKETCGGEHDNRIVKNLWKKIKQISHTG